MVDVRVQCLTLSNKKLDQILTADYHSIKPLKSPQKSNSLFHTEMGSSGLNLIQIESEATIIRDKPNSIGKKINHQ